MKLDIIVMEDNKGIRELLEIVLTTENSNVYTTCIPEDVVMRKADIYILDNDIEGNCIGDQVASIVKHNNPTAYLVSHSSRVKDDVPDGLYDLVIRKPTGIMDLKNIILNYEDVIDKK